MKSAALKALRCAIYTRKSSEEGLDQAFNSLHAQREACEAYVLSQAGEGWKALPALYDDGGFSGGIMERPALQRLMLEVDAARVDVVVVYKVDRLTRSLADFAKIVERFDRAGVSFVSVTQAFNTTSSMGRLTLNVLLSFAQFEREVTGERIRDKIAAFKKKGMWMGGLPPLGYDRPTDPLTRALVVAPSEADTVRLIFRRYLELGSVHRLVEWLDQQAIRSKRYTTSKAQERGGLPFSRGAAFHLLRNRLYVGDVVHKGERYPGAHPAIVDAELFDAVQKALDVRCAGRRLSESNPLPSPLKGILYDADAHPMSPTTAQGKSRRRYRYYVSSPLQKGATCSRDATRRVSARALETLLAERISRFSAAANDLSQAVRSGLIRRVDALPNSLAVTLDAGQVARWMSDPQATLAELRCQAREGERVWAAPDGRTVHIAIPVSPRLSGGRTRFIAPDGRDGAAAPRADFTLVKALRAAHTWARRLQDADAPPVTSRYERNLVRLSCLAPDIQAAIFAGVQPSELTLQRLMTMDLPLRWDEQRTLLRISHPFA